MAKKRKTRRNTKKTAAATATLTRRRGRPRKNPPVPKAAAASQQGESTELMNALRLLENRVLNGQAAQSAPSGLAGELKSRLMDNRRADFDKISHYMLKATYGPAKGYEGMMFVIDLSNDTDPTSIIKIIVANKPDTGAQQFAHLQLISQNANASVTVDGVEEALQALKLMRSMTSLP